jgi:hypothetical protein
MERVSLKRVAGLAAFGLLLLSSPGIAQTRTPRAYLVTLTTPRITSDANGHVVASMEAQGDLRGMITLELDPDGAGAMKGKWAFVVAYVQNVHKDGTIATEVVDPHEDMHNNDTEHHREYIRFVRKGTVYGDVSTATLRSNADGTIAGINFAQLVVANGSMTFESATGVGSITVSPLDITVTSLSLTF